MPQNRCHSLSSCLAKLWATVFVAGLVSCGENQTQNKFKATNDVVNAEPTRVPETQIQTAPTTDTGTAPQTNSGQQSTTLQQPTQQTSGTVSQPTTQVAISPVPALPQPPTTTQTTTGPTNTAFGTSCTSGTQATISGNVYRIPQYSAALPNLSNAQPVATVCPTNFDVSPRSFTQGFPGVANLIEWFAIKFTGKINVPESGSYLFQLNSDDGSQLYLDGALLVNNDGEHAPTAVSASKWLYAGPHIFELRYYQGPAVMIALQLYWKRPSGVLEIIPASAFVR